jgi:hypothetical protein
VGFELSFAIFMVLTFITTFTPEGQTIRVTNIKQISLRYLNGAFLFDFICLMPFTILFLEAHPYMKYMYIIKSFRIIKGQDALNPYRLM